MLKRSARIWYGGPARPSRRLLSRRSLLQGSGTGAAGVMTALFLASCGGGNNNNAGKATTAAGTSTRPAGAAAPNAPAGATGTAAAASATRAAGPAASPAAAAPKRGGTLRLINAANPVSLDPFATLDATTKGITSAHYSKLLLQQGAPPDKFPSLDVIPDLAASYETPDKGLTYTFKIRGNAKFHPPLSRPVTAQDVVFSVQRFTGKGGGKPAPNASELGMVDSVEAPDDHTVVFHLKGPSATLLQRLCDDYDLLIMPQETGKAFDPTKTMVGSGPWLFDDYSPDVAVKVHRNPDWHLGPDLPYVDKVETYTVPQYATQLSQFLANNVDILATISSTDLVQARDARAGVQLLGQLRTYMGYIGFSGTVQGAPWTDPRVRQAVSLAIDRDALLNAVYNLDKINTQGFQVKYLWHNFVPAGVAYSVDPKTDAKANPYFKYDPEKAKALLAQAGYPNGFKASYHYNSGFGAVYTGYSELVSEYLSKVGINLTIGVQDNTSFFATTFAANYDGLAHFFHGYAEPGDHLYAFFYSTSAYNLGKFVDKDLDQQLDTIQSNLDAQSRRQQIINAQYYLLDKMYYVPTSFDAAPNWNGAQPSVHNPWGFMTTRGGFATGQRVHLWRDA